MMRPLSKANPVLNEIMMEVGEAAVQEAIKLVASYLRGQIPADKVPSFTAQVLMRASGYAYADVYAPLLTKDVLDDFKTMDDHQLHARLVEGGWFEAYRDFIFRSFSAGMTSGFKDPAWVARVEAHLAGKK